MILLRAVVSIFFCAAVGGAAARDCPVQPFGLIGQRWLELDGADGPLGCPVSEETGVEGQKDFTDEFTEAAPALAGHAGRLFLAWKGSGNDALNLTLSNKRRPRSPRRRTAWCWRGRKRGAPRSRSAA